MVEATLNFETGLDDAKREELWNAVNEERLAGTSGYYELPESQMKMAEEIDDFIRGDERLAYGRVRDLVVIGIGGSSLGAKAVHSLLKHTPNKNAVNVHFMENGDPVEIAGVMKEVDVPRALFIVISKSGGTIETISLFKQVLHTLSQENLDFETGRYVIAITDPGSALEGYANANDIPVFNLPSNVGGRFSVLSAVGLVPLAILGYDIKRILTGAGALRKSFFLDKSDIHDILGKGYFYASHAEQRPINALFCYANALEQLGKWYVQLWGESLGKIRPSDKKRVGLTPIGLVGSVDQHSFLQLVMEGPLDKTMSFIRIKNFGNDMTVPEISLPGLEKVDYINGQTFETLINTQCQATLEAVEGAGTPVDLLDVEEICEESVGYLLYYFQLLTSVTGAAMGVDTYNQPGVEVGKTILVEKFKNL